MAEDPGRGRLPRSGASPQSPPRRPPGAGGGALGARPAETRRHRRRLHGKHPRHGAASEAGLLFAQRRGRSSRPRSRARAGSPPERAALASEALRPAATTENWSKIQGIGESALAGVARIDCPTPREEAGVIALLMREALETPGKRAALVAPGRRPAFSCALSPPWPPGVWRPCRLSPPSSILWPRAG